MNLHKRSSNTFSVIQSFRLIVLWFLLNHRKSFVKRIENISEWVWHLLPFSEKFFKVLQRGLTCRGVGMRPGRLYNVSVVALSCPGSPQNILGLRHFLRTGVSPFPELWTLIQTLQVRLDSNCYAWTFSLDRTGGHQRWWRTTFQSQIRRNITETYGKMNFKCLSPSLRLPVDGIGQRKFWVVTVTGSGGPIMLHWAEIWG